MRNWVLEVSKDGKEWKEVDRHTNDPTLNKSYGTAVFQISKEINDFYRFIKLKQTGYSWLNTNNYNIDLRFFEFFGKLQIKSE